MYLSKSVSGNYHIVAAEPVAKPNRTATKERQAYKPILDEKAIRQLRRQREPINRVRQERIRQRRGEAMK